MMTSALQRTERLDAEEGETSALRLSLSTLWVANLRPGGALGMAWRSWHGMTIAPLSPGGSPSSLVESSPRIRNRLRISCVEPVHRASRPRRVIRAFALIQSLVLSQHHTSIHLE